jgi:hypothetical protein
MEISRKLSGLKASCLFFAYIASLLNDCFNVQIPVGRQIQAGIVVKLYNGAGQVVLVEHHDLAAPTVT